jgi:hypothetical protein
MRKDGKRRSGVSEKPRSAFTKIWQIRAQKGVSLAYFWCAFLRLAVFWER